MFLEILEEARAEAEKDLDGKTVMYTCPHGDWRQFGQPKAKRDIKSVILKEGLSEKILSDITNFLDSSQWYKDRGIPYRRGYLFHGPPGNFSGKKRE